MTNLIQYALLGIGVGAIYALLGQGIVLIYRGSGVLNIAQGGFAMVGAYLYLQLHTPGSLGTSYSTAKGWPVLPSFLVAVAATAALGLATDQLLLRRMRKASPLARLVATVCVLLVLEAVAVKHWGAEPPFVQPLLPSKVLHLGSSITLPSGYLWLLGIAVGLTAILTVVWRFTRIGWVTAAVSQNERGAAALGISPGVVSSATWTMGAALAGVAGNPGRTDHAGHDRWTESAGDPGARRRAPRRLLLVPGDSVECTVRRRHPNGRTELQLLLRRAPAHHGGVGCFPTPGGGSRHAHQRIVVAGARPYVGAPASRRYRSRALAGGPAHGCDRSRADLPGVLGQRAAGTCGDVHDGDAAAVAGGPDRLRRARCRSPSSRSPASAA